MRGRQLAIALLVTLGGLLAVGTCIGVWAQRQALDTDEWVQTSDRLLEDEPIRTAIGLHLVDRLYDADAVEARIEQVLPPRLDPLAAPASAALKQAAQRNAPRLLGNAAALKAWAKANRVAHERLIELLDRDDDDAGVSLDLRALLTQLAGDTGLPKAAADRLPPDIAEIEVLPPGELTTARKIVKALRAAAWVLAALALLAFGGAIAISRDRRRTLVSVGGALVLAGVATLAFRRLGGNLVVDELAQSPNGEQAVHDAWSIATSLLVDSALGTLLIGLLVASGAWLGGPGKLAARLRQIGGPTLRDNPAIVRVGLALALLLLVLWSPVPWTGRVVPMLLLTAGAFAWLEWLRRRTVAEAV